jgi:hypothetical protein
MSQVAKSRLMAVVGLIVLFLTSFCFTQRVFQGLTTEEATIAVFFLFVGISLFIVGIATENIMLDQRTKIIECLDGSKF